MPAQKTSREALIAQSLKVFRRQGYHGTSIQQLAQACGIQKAHFYYYFESKAHLMQEILESVRLYFQERIYQLAADENLSPQARLEQLMTAMERVLLGGKGGCIMGNTALELSHFSPEPEGLEIVRQYFDQAISALAHIFATQFSPSEAREHAEHVIQDIEGGLILSQLYQDPSYVHRATQRARSILD